MKTACLVSLVSGLCALAPLCAAEDNELLDQACWIWYDKDTNAIDQSIAKSEFTFTKELTLDGPVSEALLRVTAESAYSLSVNGKAVGSDDKPLTLESYDIKPLLIPGKNELAVKAKTKTWFAGLFVAGTITLGNGKTVTVISDDTWNCTVAGDATPRKAETVIRGINGGWWNNCNRVMEMPADWYRLNTEVAAPGIAWAKPWAGAKVRVLAIHPRARQWDTIELAHRTDMELTAVFCDRQEQEGQSAPFFPDTKGWRRKDVVESLTKALAGSYDVIVLDQVDEEIFYEAVAGRLKEMVGKGTGLVYTALPARKLEKPGEKKPASDPAFEKELTAAPIPPLSPPWQGGEKGGVALLTTGIPYAQLPGFHIGEKDKEKDFRKVAALYRFGQGRIVRLSLGSGLGQLANANDPVDLHYEYYISFAIKTLLWASGKEPALGFRNLPATLTAEHKPEGSGELTSELAGTGGARCAVNLSIRSPERLCALPATPVARPGIAQGELFLRPLHQAQVEVAGDGPVKFALPPLPAGTYFLDLEVSQNGRKANWATVALTVTARPALTEVRMAAPFIDVADGKAAAVQATAMLSEGAPEGTTVRFALLDNHDRLLQQSQAQVAKGEDRAEGVFLVRSFSTTLGHVRAELRVGDDLLAVGIGRFTARRRDWDRFFFVGWAGQPPSRAGHVYDRMLAGLGLDARRGRIPSLEDLEIADTVALPNYQGMPRDGVDLSPERLGKVREETWKTVRAAVPLDPVAYFTGDEIDYRGGDEHPSRIADFRLALKKKYGAIAALNKQWETTYASFDEVGVLTAGAVKDEDKPRLTPEKEYLEKANVSRNYSRWVDQWLNNYRVFNDMNRLARQIIKEFDPCARVGVDCPMWEFARCGHDWYAHMKEFEMFAPYGREGETQPYEDARSFARPSSFLGLTYGGYLYNAFARREELTDVEWHRWRLWHGLLRGFSSVWWYNLSPGASEGNVSPGLLPYPTLEEACRQMTRIRSGYHTLFSRQRRDYGRVAIHYSIPSRLATHLLGDFGNECAFNDHFLMQILRNDAGQSYTFVADEQIAAGALRDYKVLLLTTASAVGEAEARELRRFVEAGGILIADTRPGITDEHGRWDEKNRLPALFGLSWKKELGRKMLTAEIAGEYKGVAMHCAAQKFPADPAVELKGAKAVSQADGVPLIAYNDVGKGTAICLNIPFNYYRGYPTPDHLYLYRGERDHNRLIGTVLSAILKAHAIERTVRLGTADGVWPWGLETSYHNDGEAQYVGLTKQRESRNEKDCALTVTAPRAGHVYDMLNGTGLGRQEAWHTTVHPADVQLYSILPYAVKGLEVRLAAETAPRGGNIAGTVTVDTGGAQPVRHVIHMEVIRPDGQAASYLSANLETTGGTARFRIPLALNEPEGEYTLAFSDVATQTRREAKVKVGR